MQNIVRLDYAEEPANLWPEILGEIRARGVTGVRTRVLWGAHEPVRGMRDFTKASRLRLEKFLALAQSNELQVSLELGFPAHRETFPAWTFESDKPALIPAGVWDENEEGYALVSLPSLFDESVLEAFRAFTEEALALIQLYRKPEGPVSDVSLTLGVLRSDLNCLEQSRFADALERRYGEIGALNTVYQTAFKKFTPLASRAGYRALLERRPWLAAYDYRWCRKLMLSELCSRLGLSAGEDSGTIAEGVPFRLVVDGIAVEAASSPHPFAPAGLLHASTIAAYRFAEYLHANASRDGIPVRWLGLDEAAFASNVPIFVLCGKYFPRAAMERLKAAADGGANVRFPLGFPQYDENLTVFERWAADRRALPLGQQVWAQLRGLEA